MMQEKTFYLQNQQTKTSQIIKHSIPTYGSLVNLQSLLQSIPEYNRKIFKIYNPENDSYINFNSNSPFSSPYICARDYLNLSILMIKYSDNPAALTSLPKNKDAYNQDSDSSNNEEQQENNSNQGPNQNQNKKERSRERNIREVIEVVQKWRQYHDNPPDGKRRTLQEAASFVGVSKKSLDDYYYQLRVGQKYDFDFEGHLEDKIGVLRSFIKQKDPQRRVSGKNSKHPKKLKIIEQFSQKLRITQSSNSQRAPNPKSSSKSKQQQPPSPLQSYISQINFPYPFNQPNSAQIQYNNESQHESKVDQIFWGAPFNELSEEKYMDVEKKYYDDFGFSLEEFGDPYLEFLPFRHTASEKSDKLEDQ